MFSFAGSLIFWVPALEPKGFLSKSWIPSDHVQLGKLQYGARRDPGMGAQRPGCYWLWLAGHVGSISSISLISHLQGVGVKSVVLSGSAPTPSYCLGIVLVTTVTGGLLLALSGSAQGGQMSSCGRAQLHSTKNLPLTCVISKCPRGYLCGENPIHNELNLHSKSVSHVKAKHFLLGFTTH